MPIAFPVAVAIVLGLLAFVFKYPCLGLGPVLFGSWVFAIFMLAVGLSAGTMYLMLGFLVLAITVFHFKNPGLLRNVSRQELAIVTLGILLLISFFYTSAPTYGTDKALRFFGWIIPLTIAARLFSSTREHLTKAFSVLSVFASITILFHALLYATARDALTEHDRFGGLGLAWYSAICIALAVYPIYKGGHWRRLFACVSILAGLLVIGASGSRGPFFGVFLAAGLAFLGRRALIRSALVLVVLVGVGWYVKGHFLSYDIQKRLADTDVEATGRPTLWRAGISQFLDHPIRGGGIGSFAVYAHGHDIAAWPHNTWLEVAGELGVPGLTCLLVAFAYTVGVVLRVRKLRGPLVPLSKSYQMLFWIGVLNTLVSLDINRQVGLFASIGIAAGMHSWIRFTADAHQPMGIEWTYQQQFSMGGAGVH